jgi:two-component system LytT family sensor kinase
MRRSINGLLYFGVWTLIGIFFATQTYIGGLYSDRPLTWTQAFIVALVAWYLRALFAPAIFWLAQRFTISRSKWFKSVLIHVAASLAFAIAEQVIYDAVVIRFSEIPRRILSPVELHMNLLTYWAVLGVAHFRASYRRSRESELAASQLEAELNGAKLDLLRAQLHPHFLFNTLNGISELMHEDVEQADLMLGNLSEMLRSALEHSGKREVTLSAELEFLRRFLEVQSMRFQHRLTFQIVAPPELLSCCVPYLVLQPIVENSILHGIARSPAAGSIRVNACDKNGMLQIEVRNTGPGLPSGGIKEGLGLRNTRLRLLHSYGVHYKLEVANALEGGVRVTVEFPVSRDEARPPALAMTPQN